MSDCYLPNRAGDAARTRDELRKLAFQQSFPDMVVFTTMVKRGRGYSAVRINVDAALITALAEAIRVTGHAGHAVWHLINATDIPCGSCADRIPTHPGGGSND